MKVLVATARTQGESETDFCDTTEGELVIIPGDCLTPDCRCERGCDPSFLGLNSGQRTTTVTIVNRPFLHPPAYAKMVAIGLRRLGFVDPNCLGCDHCDFVLEGHLLDLDFLAGPGLIEKYAICRQGCDYSQRSFEVLGRPISPRFDAASL